MPGRSEEGAKLDLTRAIDGKRGWLAAGVALALILSFGIVGFILATSPDVPSPAQLPTAAAPPSVAPPPPAAQPPPSAATASGPVSTVVERLKQRGFQVTERGTRSDGDCVAASYSGTQSFLKAHPCAGLQRAMFEVRGARSGTALVAVCWVSMPDEDSATALRAVVDRPGSGNITALERNNLFTGVYYASSQRGVVVSNADARPLSPGLTESELKAIVAAASD